MYWRTPILGQLLRALELTVPLKDDYSDGLLTTPYEYVDVPFTICQLGKSPFVLFVDVLGRIR